MPSPILRTARRANDRRKKIREFAARHPVSLTVYRGAIVITGFLTIVLGIIAVVTPLPSFIILFAGFGLLATEVAWAKKIFDKLKPYAKASIVKVSAFLRLK